VWCRPGKSLTTVPRSPARRPFQALTALLERDVPPMDATARLLDEAIGDAIEHRRTTCPKCTANESCAGCAANWRKADALGIIGELPRRAHLKAVQR
jgi:hypothetical protein